MLVVQKLLMSGMSVLTLPVEYVCGGDIAPADDMPNVAMPTELNMMVASTTLTFLRRFFIAISCSASVGLSGRAGITLRVFDWRHRPGRHARTVRAGTQRSA